MKTIIAGSREINDSRIVDQVIQNEINFTVTEVVCGCAGGVDTLGDQWANQHGVPVKYFPARWRVLGKMAGFARNIQMANYADCLIAIWDGHSRGTKHMIDKAKELGLNVHVHIYKP